MAVSGFDKKKLSQSQQDRISSITKDAQSGRLSWSDAHDRAERIRAGAGYSGGRYGDGNYRLGDDTGGFGDASPDGSGRGSGGGDAAEYLKELYARRTQAKLEALQAAYQQNAANLWAGAERIPQVYAAAKNETAAQSELARRAFNEYAAARGLNSGASGQAALASSSALQGNLAELRGRQADALAENALAQQQLAREYTGAVNEVRSGGEADLSSALYQELVRRQEAAARERAEERTRADREAQQEAGRESSARQYAFKLAQSMLSAGIMPDGGTLAAAGISDADARAIVAAAAREQAGKTSGRSAARRGSGGSSGGNTVVSAAGNGTAPQAAAGEVSGMARGLLTDLRKYYLTNASMRRKVKTEYNNGKGALSAADYRYLLHKLGADSPR